MLLCLFNHFRASQRISSGALQILSRHREGVERGFQIAIETGQIVLSDANAIGHVGEDCLPAAKVFFEPAERVGPDGFPIRGQVRQN